MIVESCSLRVSPLAGERLLRVGITVTGRYLGLVLEHIRGEIVASSAFNGWLRKPGEVVLLERRKWCHSLIGKLGIGH